MSHANSGEAGGFGDRMHVTPGLSAKSQAKVLRELMHRAGQLALSAAIAAATMFSTVHAPAQGPARSGKKSEGKAKADAPKIDLTKIKAALESGDERRITPALEELEQAGEGAKEAAPLVEALLRQGSSASVLEKALSTAGALKQASSSAAIAPYVRHRAPEVRRTAAKMLIKTKGPEAVRALRQGLRSTDAVVRGTSATGLGALGAKEAIGDLFGALDKNVGEAAAAIGQLCTGAECDKLLDRVGKQPFEIMSSGFDQLLFRPAAEVADDQKIRVIGRLRELGTKESGAFLADVAERWPKDWSPKVKQALDAAVKATGASRPGAGG
jgi:HEAT repeat protein